MKKILSWNTLHLNKNYAVDIKLLKHICRKLVLIKLTKYISYNDQLIQIKKCICNDLNYQMIYLFHLFPPINPKLIKSYSCIKCNL